MRDRFFGLLGIESGEESMVSMLLMQSVFLGIFFGAFDISAHSLFLSIFDEKMMARGYVVSGFAGIILTSLYTWLQTRMKFKNFAIANLFTVTLLTLLLWITLNISPAKWVIFFVFIMLGPLNILAMLGFWGTTGRLFTLRQGKRLFGLVDSGLIIGIIISCYTIPVILSLNFKSHNILLISSISVLIASAIQVMIASRFRFVSAKQDKEEKAPEKKSILTVFKTDRYTRIMAIFIALSVMTAFFVQYSFMAVTREQYPAEEDMARFLGIFTGSMMIFTLLVKLLVFSYIIRNYGLKICLAVSPVLIAIFTLVAIIIGITMGYTPEAISGFLIFFLILALSRLFSKSLKDSIESPSFKVIYQTIDEKIRYEIQSGMDGTVNEIAALSSGLLLAGLGLLSFIRLIHFSFVLFFIIILWILVSFMLYSEYRKSIRRALEAAGPDLNQKTEVHLLRNRFSARLAFRKEYYSLISDDSLLPANKNKWYLENLIDHAASVKDLKMLPVLKKISGDKGFDERLRRKSEEAIRDLMKNQGSGEIEIKRTESAWKMLSGGRVPQTTEILRLLRDNSIESKRLAIFMIGKFRLTDLLPEICQSLNNSSLETDAASVLISFGDEATDDLTRYFMASSGNIDTGRTILRLLGQIKSKKGCAFLFSRLWSNSRQMREAAVNSLIEAEFKPSEEEKDRLHQLISEIVGIMTWNLSAKVCLEKNSDSFLSDLLKKDIAGWNTFLFKILSITYDKGSINKIRENLEKETVESGNFALEMIDIVIDDSIKPKIIALLDLVPDETKLKNLYQFFPAEIPSYFKLQEDIINRDYNLVGLWTKACVLRNLEKTNDSDIAESVSALLFSQQGILQEEAAKFIARSDKNLYDSVSLRLAQPVRERLDKIVNKSIKDEELIFEKMMFLKNNFKNIPEEDLMILTKPLVFVNDLSTESFESKDCIVWPLTEKKDVGDVYIHYGNNGDKEKLEKVRKASIYFLPLRDVEEFHNHHPETSAEILTYIDKNEE